MKVWLILAAIVCALAFALLMDGQRMAPSPTETDAERLQSAREAFNVDATAQTHEGVAQWLAAMQTAISARDQQAVAGLFDAEKILEELQARGAVPRMALRERRAALQGLERGLGRSLMPGLLNEPWSTVELRKVESYDQDRKVVAYVRHRDQDGYGVGMG